LEAVGATCADGVEETTNIGVMRKRLQHRPKKQERMSGCLEELRKTSDFDRKGNRRKHTPMRALECFCSLRDIATDAPELSWRSMMFWANWLSLGSEVKPLWCSTR